MRKISKKIISCILALGLVFSVCTAGFGSVHAAEPDPSSATSVAELLAQVAHSDVSRKHTIRAFTDYVGNFQYLITTVKAFGSAFNNINKIMEYNSFGGAMEKIMYNLLNILCNRALDVVNALFPEPDHFVNVEDYVSKNFYPGHETMITEEQKGAKWSLGYANASLIPNDFKPGVYDMGGSLHVLPVKAQQVLDDMKIRVTCIDDGTGRGTVVMAVIDALGISNTDIRIVRELLADFAKENNIVSINISATHSHSCIDMQGFSSAFVSSIVWNAISGEYNIGKTVSGRNEHFMDNFYNVSANAIKEAFNNMTEGTLKYSVGDISQFVKDKEPPYTFVKEAGCFRFIPDNGSRETYFINMTCHPTTMDHVNGTDVSSDFIYYMEEQFNKMDYNFMYIQGAVGAVTKVTDTIEDMPKNPTRVETAKYFGIALANFFMDLDKSTEEVIKPILNARSEEFLLKCTNNLLVLAVKSQLLDNNIVRVGNDLSYESYRLVTEMGYITFGNKVMFGLMPCEMYPEVSIGGAATEQDSWTNEPFDMCLIDLVTDSLDYYTVCFANDTYGYVMADNSYAFLYPDSPADTLLSSGSTAASQTINEFEHLLAQDKIFAAK